MCEEFKTYKLRQQKSKLNGEENSMRMTDGTDILVHVDDLNLLRLIF